MVLQTAAPLCQWNGAHSSSSARQTRIRGGDPVGQLPNAPIRVMPKLQSPTTAVRLHDSGLAVCLLPTGDKADHVPQPNSSNGPIRLLPLTPSFPIRVSCCGPRYRLDAHAMDLVSTSLESRGVFK